MSSAHSRESGNPALGPCLRRDERINGVMRVPTVGDFHMPSWRKKPPNKQDFLKRRTFEEGCAQGDAAHIATQRLYCDVLNSGAAAGFQAASGTGAAAASRPDA
jgi:hypothetical protein